MPSVESVQNSFETEPTEIGTVELNQNFFKTLAEVEAKLPATDRQWYHTWLNIIHEQTFDQAERLLEDFLGERQKKLDKSHEAFPIYLGQLAKVLRRNGIEVPWFDPERDGTAGRF